MAQAKRGFEAMSKDKQKEIASKGGKASRTHKQGLTTKDAT